MLKFFNILIVLIDFVGVDEVNMVGKGTSLILLLLAPADILSLPEDI